MALSNRRPKKQEQGYERISLTAWLVAYQRSLSDIPLSQEILYELEENVKQTWPASQIEELEKLKYPAMAPLWEARFKIVNRLLNAQHVDQILEIAAGFSPRGLDLATDSTIEYVELDLQSVVAEKSRIIDKLVSQSRVPKEPNLHLEVGNALKAEDLLAATRFFKAKPIAVVNEGLLHYLDLAQKEALAKSIHELLQVFGGVWITPDISTDTQIKPGPIGVHIQERTVNVQTMTGIDVLKNRFDNEQMAREFFQGLGFAVERHGFDEIAGELISPQHENLSEGKMALVTEQLVAFVMKVR